LKSVDLIIDGIYKGQIRCTRLAFTRQPWARSISVIRR
jgi:hypothetical protein